MVDTNNVKMLNRNQPLKDRWTCTTRIWEYFRRLSGWRKSALINTVLTSTVLLILLSSHTFLWVKSGNPAGYHIIHSGSCAGNGVGRLNTLLHLIINGLSSLVLASTNFFMQVLNAPTRYELDRVHEKGSWLDIGVPSPRNAFKVSRFKTITWLLFFLSSIPIHLLFNSTIFSTDYRESMFNYFVFDESILTGGAAFDPGTSFAIPGGYSFGQPWMEYYDPFSSTWGNSTALDIGRKWYFETVYPEKSLAVRKAVEEIQSGAWHKLDKSNCNSLYNSTYCSGIRAYRNVALILAGSSGWNRSQVWDLSANDSSFWDAHVPKDINNALWFAYYSNNTESSCVMFFHSAWHGGSGTEVSCLNSCDSSMGISDMWNYKLFPPQHLDIQGADFRISLASTTPGIEFANSSLSVEYCLAEPFGTICQIGLASTLLWVVSTCVLLKTVLCVVVITKLGKDTSLVTPGDVIESFISNPPDYPLGSCILEGSSSRVSRDRNRHSLLPRPTQWISKRHRRWCALSKRIWLSSYLIFSIGIVLLIYYFSISYAEYGYRWQGSFGQDVGNMLIRFPNEWRPTLEQAILIANSPQLFLSFTYLSFNSLFTRLHMAKEWSSMSTRYKALRVTDPHGQQSSTYFLQLPYRYSVPLLIISILLHWVLSGCIYLLVLQGGYFDSFDSEGPFGSFMTVGSSLKSLFTMMILSAFLALMPLIFGGVPLPSNTVVVGSNSLAIAAACQVSPLVGRKQPQQRRSDEERMADHQDDEVELRHLLAPSANPLNRDDQTSESGQNEEERKATLLRVSQSKIRWGVVKMPSSWEEQFNRQDISVEHISFGLPEDDVQQPITGHWYA